MTLTPTLTQGLDLEALGAKVKPLLPVLREKGEVYLLALFERDDVPDRLDLAMSSEWADSSRNAAVKLAVSYLGPLLSPEEQLALSRVVVISSSVPMVTLLAANFECRTGDGDRELQFQRHSDQPRFGFFTARLRRQLMDGMTNARDQQKWPKRLPISTSWPPL